MKMTMGLGLNRRRASGGGGGPAGTITIDSITYTRGTAGVAPDLTLNVSSTGTTSPNYITTAVLAASAQNKAQIDASGDKFTITKGTIAFSNEPIDLNNSQTNGVISAYVTDSSDPAIVSAVASTAANVTYDHVAPAFSSAVVENAAPSNLVITLTKDAYEAGTLAPADFTLGGTYGGSISTATLTNPTTITLGLSTPVVNGDTLTVALVDGTVLVGIDAEPVAAWSAESVTNNVAAAGGISFVGKNHLIGRADTTDNAALDLSGLGLQENDIVIIHLATAAGTVRTPSVSGWTTITGPTTVSDIPTITFVAYYKIMGATPDSSITWGSGGFSSDGSFISAHAYRGVDTTTPLDGVSPVITTSADTALPNPGSITPATSGAWIHFAMAGGSLVAAPVDFATPGYLTQATNASGAGSTNDVALLSGYYEWTSGAYDGAAVTESGGPNDTTTYVSAAIAIALRPA